jgi:class 3 adenylate cyclase
VDKYMGDGVLFRFNVPHPVADHPAAAVRCAWDMQAVFRTVKKDWLTMGEVLGGIYSRIGLACGPVQKATVGHPQYQYLTIFGRAVNAAVNLCESAVRDRDVIVIDQLLYDQVKDGVRVEPLPPERLGKARNYTKAGYEITGVTGAPAGPG